MRIPFRSMCVICSSTLIIQVFQHRITLGVMARRKMIRCRAILLRQNWLFQNWLFVDAALPLAIVKLTGKFLAPRTETTTGWRIGRAWQVALQNDPAAGSLLARVRQRDCREQRLSIRMGRNTEHPIHFSDFSDLAEIHDGDAVGNVPDHGQIMSNEEI